MNNNIHCDCEKIYFYGLGRCFLELPDRHNLSVVVVQDPNMTGLLQYQELTINHLGDGGLNRKKMFRASLRGHLGVQDTVSGPTIVPLSYLVILQLIHLKAYTLLKADNF